MASTIGKLIKVDLREIWKNEEYDFSSWLAQEHNLSLLSDEIGISIKNMGEDCLFFAIRIEAWRINDSDPAPKFEVICKPNAWAKVVKHSSEGKGLGETDLKKLDFWTKLKSYANDKKVPLFRQTPAPQHWYNISIGSSEAHIVLTMNTRDNLMKILAFPY